MWHICPLNCCNGLGCNQQQQQQQNLTIRVTSFVLFFYIKLNSLELTPDSPSRSRRITTNSFRLWEPATKPALASIFQSFTEISRRSKDSDLYNLLDLNQEGAKGILVFFLFQKAERVKQREAGSRSSSSEASLSFSLARLSATPTSSVINGYSGSLLSFFPFAFLFLFVARSLCSPFLSYHSLLLISISSIKSLNS